MEVFSSSDQADTLRRIINPRPLKIIAISSGKGGVGKTNVSINLALAMAKQGKDVMVLDADLGLANVDVLLGLRTEYDLSHVISGERSLDEIIVDGPEGIRIIPASSGVNEMANLTPSQQMGLINAFSELGHAVDVLIVDTGAGLSDTVTNFCTASQDVVVVVHDEPASITDAYAFIKVMSRKHKISRFHVLANMTRNAHEGSALFKKLTVATDRFLDVMLTYLGTVPYDEKLRKAVQHQKAVVEAFPRSPSALAFKRISRQINNWPEETMSSQGKSTGGLKFFVERIIQSELLVSNIAQTSALNTIVPQQEAC
jgi:flagellar biosynthesis protein FlhG